MFYKNIIIFLFVIGFSSLVAQTRNKEWQVGIGAGVTMFSDEDALFIGDKTQFQIPRVNITMPLTNNLAIDGAISFQTLDFGFITNEDGTNYLSLDASLRYFYNLSDILYPYVFAGASLTDANLKITPTFNIGAGATFWINDIVGFNTQIYYKYSLDSFESMRSHIQITAGMVFALDPFDLLFKGVRKKGFCSSY